jgi:hypothetical protein
MSYAPNNLKTEAFIAGKIDLYNVVRENPELRMVPIAQLNGVRHGLQQLGYSIRIRYRGARRKTHNKDTLKQDACAFTVYFDQQG